MRLLCLASRFLCSMVGSFLGGNGFAVAGSLEIVGSSARTEASRLLFVVVAIFVLLVLVVVAGRGCFGCGGGGGAPLRLLLLLLLKLRY